MPGSLQSLHSDPALSPTLPGRYYHDPKVLEAETEAIFHRTWQLIGHQSQIKNPGDYITAEILGQKLFALRGDDGEIRAFYNVCQHRAHGLLSGESGNTRNTIVCPYHAWTYRLDGSLRTARGSEMMPAFQPQDYGLTPVRLEEGLGFLFVCFDETAPGLEATLGGALADIKETLRWIEEVEVLTDVAAGNLSAGELAANWKVLAENCLECYHCTPAHPAFVDLVSIESYSCATAPHWMKSAGDLRRSENKAYPVEADAAVQQGLFWHLFPNSQIGAMPGERVVSGFNFLPVTAERTAMRYFLLAVPGDAPTAERVAYVNEVLWPEDEALCESVHQGLKSKGYRQGRFIMHPERPGISENGVHHFQLLYAKAMGLDLLPA
ncbi:MAG: aromatic ring-hydroxylating dioxygenase subunit alpha [Pseudomonadota bacterium]